MSIPLRSFRLLCVVVLSLLAVGCGGDEEPALEVIEQEEVVDAGPADIQVHIPEGSGELVDQGRPLNLMPQELNVEVGEVIEIINEDSRGYLVGPFYVGANETVRHEFSAPGSFVGECSVSSSGQITINVT